jgi:predicted RNA-binding Zn-ribbon protein involved in translation (DUF1610 family)
MKQFIKRHGTRIMCYECPDCGEDCVEVKLHMLMCSECGYVGEINVCAYDEN